MALVSSVDLAGRRVLVVEDQFVIALDMEQMLRALGAGVIDLVTTTPDALAAIAQAPPDLAILDVKLETETTVPIAEALQARAIPLIFVSGYGDLNAVPLSLRGTALLRKPVDRAALADILSQLLAA